MTRHCIREPTLRSFHGSGAGVADAALLPKGRLLNDGVAGGAALLPKGLLPNDGGAGGAAPLPKVLLPNDGGTPPNDGGARGAALLPKGLLPNNGGAGGAALLPKGLRTTGVAVPDAAPLPKIPGPPRPKLKEALEAAGAGAATVAPRC